MSDVPDVIQNRAGERIDYSYHPGAARGGPVVVIGHGVTGHKDRPILIALADGLARAGVAALRISFSGNAASEGRFEESNITKEVADLGAVLDALRGRAIAYAGHSMGGAVGVLRASHDPRIRLLVSLAAMVHTHAFAKRTFGHLTPGEGLMLEKPGCVLSQRYLDDLGAIGSVLPQAEQVTVPWLFVHGTRDELVPIEDTYDAHAATRAPKKLVVLEGADHVFEPGLVSHMVQAVTEWCRSHFAAGL
ncbi:MAG TPA: alpha/beta fold hydrolase [Polyangiaceae bacterium]